MIVLTAKWHLCRKIKLSYLLEFTIKLKRLCYFVPKLVLSKYRCNYLLLNCNLISRDTIFEMEIDDNKFLRQLNYFYNLLSQKNKKTTFISYKDKVNIYLFYFVEIMNMNLVELWICKCWISHYNGNLNVMKVTSPIATFLYWLQLNLNRVIDAIYPIITKHITDIDMI